ncbi:MAG: hypothetical protein DRI30_07040 [Chloroflexi bacterium]|nr:MAG: hypothetical protein DRI30_07040 [Chloroflexota bacterium]
MPPVRAAFCTARNTLEVRETDDPKPGPGEVLVRVRQCGICGTDLHFYRGNLPPSPASLGHEFTGEIAALGEGVEGFAEGDSVRRADPRLPDLQLLSQRSVQPLPEPRPPRRIPCGRPGGARRRSGVRPLPAARRRRLRDGRAGRAAGGLRARPAHRRPQRRRARARDGQRFDRSLLGAGSASLRRQRGDRDLPPRPPGRGRGGDGRDAHPQGQRDREPEARKR